MREARKRKQWGTQNKAGNQNNNTSNNNKKQRRAAAAPPQTSPKDISSAGVNKKNSATALKPKASKEIKGYSRACQALSIVFQYWIIAEDLEWEANASIWARCLKVVGVYLPTIQQLQQQCLPKIKEEYLRRKQQRMERDGNSIEEREELRNEVLNTGDEKVPYMSDDIRKITRQIDQLRDIGDDDVEQLARFGVTIQVRYLCFGINRATYSNIYS